MIIYTRYKHSKLATLMSGLGSVAVVGGVYLIAQSVGFMVGSGGTAGSPSDSVTGNVFEDIIVGIICMIVGVGIRILAQSVAEKKEAKLAVKARVAEKTGIEPKKKMGVGKIIGIILFVVQAVAVIFSTTQENSIWMQIKYSSGASAAGLLLGYFLPAIIGIILLCKSSKKQKRAVNTDKAASTVKPDTTASTASTFTSTIASTAPTRRCCPKCGAEAEAGDDFCIYCGAPLRK